MMKEESIFDRFRKMYDGDLNKIRKVCDIMAQKVILDMSTEPEILRLHTLSAALFGVFANGWMEGKGEIKQDEPD